MQDETTFRIPHSALRIPGPWWTRPSKYMAVLRMSVGNNLAYWGEVLLRSVFMVLIIFVFVQLWTLTYSTLGVSQLGEYSLPQMIWYFAFAEAIALSTPLLRTKVDGEVKSGELAYRLSKPYNYVLYHAADYGGERLVRFVINLVIGCVVALVLVGPIPFSVGGLLSVATILPMALALDFLFSCGIALLAFWVEDTWAFDFIYRRLVMLLGGMMIPLDVFPEPLASIAKALPFSYMMYGPSRLWVAPTLEFFLGLFVRLVVSLVVAAVIVALMFRAGQRNVTVNGG